MRAVSLDVLTALYDRRSGQTHLVTEPVPEVLAALREPADVGALAVRLGVEGEIEALQARLDELIALGLIGAP